MLGSGLGYRACHKTDLFLHRDQIDFLELTADEYLDGSPETLDELDLLSAHFRVTLHSLELSPAAASGIDSGYLHRVAALVRRSGAVWWSDHLAFTHAGGRQIGGLTPVPFTHQALDVTARAVRRAVEAAGVPFLVENITRGIRLPGDEMSETEFLTRLVERTGCGLLLDVSNLLINSINWGFDPEEWLAGIPAEAVIELHYAGGHEDPPFQVDSHAHPVSDPVWLLLGRVCRLFPVCALLLERDENIPPLGDLLPEVARARELGREASLWS